MTDRPITNPDIAKEMLDATEEDVKEEHSQSEAKNELDNRNEERPAADNNKEKSEIEHSDKDKGLNPTTTEPPLVAETKKKPIEVKVLNFVPPTQGSPQAEIKGQSYVPYSQATNPISASSDAYHTATLPTEQHAVKSTITTEIISADAVLSETNLIRTPKKALVGEKVEEEKVKIVHLDSKIEKCRNDWNHRSFRRNQQHSEAMVFSMKLTL